MSELVPAQPVAGQPSAVEPSGEVTIFEGHPSMVPSIGALLLVILTVGFGLIYLWLRARGTHFKITTERVVVERGMFSKVMDQIDLYRINDYTVERPFSQRLLGTGNLVLEAMDRSTPHLRLDGLKTDVVQLYERVRKATEAEKRRRGVRVIDTE